MYYCAENKGRTLHLLKKASKPVPQNRKRIKRDIFASPLDFQRLHADFAEERKGEPEIEPEPVQVNPLGHVPAGGGPNIIGTCINVPMTRMKSNFSNKNCIGSNAKTNMVPDKGHP